MWIWRTQRPPPTPAPDELSRQLTELLQRRDELISNRGAEQKRLAQCRHGLIKEQIGRLIAQLTEQIKQLICLNALLPQQLEHKGPQRPSQYTTKSEQVIDVELHPAQSLPVAPNNTHAPQRSLQNTVATNGQPRSRGSATLPLDALDFFL
jgi:hypothetical protein